MISDPTYDLTNLTNWTRQRRFNFHCALEKSAESTLSFVGSRSWRRLHRLHMQHAGSVRSRRRQVFEFSDSSQVLYLCTTSRTRCRAAAAKFTGATSAPRTSVLLTRLNHQGQGHGQALNRRPKTFNCLYPPTALIDFKNSLSFFGFLCSSFFLLVSFLYHFLF